MSSSVWPHRRQPTRLPRPWDSPGKYTGVGCHFLLQSMKVKRENEVAQSCPTLCDPRYLSTTDRSLIAMAVWQPAFHNIRVRTEGAWSTWIPVGGGGWWWFISQTRINKQFLTSVLAKPFLRQQQHWTRAQTQRLEGQGNQTPGGETRAVGSSRALLALFLRGKHWATGFLGGNQRVCPWKEADPTFAPPASRFLCVGPDQLGEQGYAGI